MVNNKEALEAYREALGELIFCSPLLGSLAQRMGRPVWDENQPTAYVTLDDQGNAVFAFNPDFILTLTVEEAGAVLGHEASHLLLNHLKEIADPAYPNQEALVKAQECIINDNLESRYSMTLPADVMRGPTLINRDLSDYSTLPAYALFDNQEEQDGQGNDDAEGEGEGDSEEGSGSGQGNGAGQGNGGSTAPGSDPASGDGQGQSQGGATPGEQPQGGSMPGGTCGGFDLSQVDPGDLAKAIQAVVSGTAKEMGVTEAELQDILVGNDSSPGYSPTGAPLTEKETLSQDRMNWRDLLAKINPKVLEAGKPRRRTRNDWATYNRRMSSVYPKVILPSTRTIVPKKDDEGDQLPVFVVALDLSGSIDRRLVGMLQGLLKDIPEALIKAYPCTWGSRLRPFTEEEGWRVEGGGTDIHLVSDYVAKVAKETGTDPYVLVITDGEFYTNFKRPGKDWVWMGVDDSSVRRIKAYHAKGQDVYHVRDFRARG